MRIAMIGHKRYGSRGGGVEVVVTELARRMAALGHEVICYDRGGRDVVTGKTADLRERIVDGVRVVPVCIVDRRGFAALTGSFAATRLAITERPDVIHYHAEGPCVSLPLARRAGMRTVATIHGLDWQRTKWGRLARGCIKWGERAAAIHANDLVVLSQSAKDYFKESYGRDAVLIPNGVETKTTRPADAIRCKWGLEANSYVLYLGRIVPEKRLDLLIEAFRGLDTTKRLVVAGYGSDAAGYEMRMRRAAEDDPRVLFAGFVSDEMLDELYSNAYAFVLPSDVEGMSMSLLEAMAYGCACVTSDIPECSEVLAEAGVTFARGNGDALRNTLASLLADPDRAAVLGCAARERVQVEYNWNVVIESTLSMYAGEVVA